MAQKSLEDALKNVRNPVEMLRNSQVGAYVYPVVPASSPTGAMSNARGANTAVLSISPTTWWTCTSKGPDALKLLSNLAINSFNNFPVNRAKQFVPCSYSGHVIGDGILFHLEQNKLVFVGRAPSANWIQLPRRDRRLQSEDHATTTARPATRRARPSTGSRIASRSRARRPGR